MMERPAPEFTIICIDNAKRAFWNASLMKAQIEATKLYCETVFECNPNNIVTILGMSSNTCGIVVYQTSDLEEILSALKGLHCQHDGVAQFQPTLTQACLEFSLRSDNMKRRLLMFVAGTIDLSPSKAFSCGEELRSSGVALDVFNFYYLNLDPSVDRNTTLYLSKYHYAREELEMLVKTANKKGSCHIVDIVDEYAYSAIKSTERMLKMHKGYLEKKAAADEKNKSARAEKNKSDEAPETQFVKPRLERFHSERTKTAAGHFRTDWKPKWIKKVEKTKWTKKVENSKQ